MHVVAAVVDQGALTFDLAIPCEVFGLDRSDIVDPWYEFLLVAAGRRRVRTQTGFVIEPPHGLEELERADTIVVPGWSDPDDEPSRRAEGGADRTRMRAARGSSRSARARSSSPRPVCSTAAARRRTGCTPTACRRRYPRVRIDPDVLYVADDRIMTSAGTAAGIDLCLHLVALDHGLDVAATVARRLVMPLFRAGGQAQYVDTPIAARPARPRRAARLGAREPRRGHHRRRPRDARRDEHADADPSLPLGDRHAAGGVAPARAPAPGAAAAGADRRPDRGRGAPRRATTRPATMRAQFASRLHTSPRAYRETFRGRRTERGRLAAPSSS